MNKIVLVLIIAVGGFFLISLVPGHDFSISSNPLLPRPKFSVPVPKNGTDSFGSAYIETQVTSVTGGVSKNIDTLKQALDPKNITDRLNEVKNNVSKVLIGKLAETLQVSSPSNGAGGVTNTLISGGKRLEVCLSQKQGEEIVYVIENPFWGKSGVLYKVEWGDDTISNGGVGVKEGNVLVSHIYSASGKYVNSFAIESGSTTVISERSVCVQ